MREDFLIHLWATQMIDKIDLQTTEGVKLDVMQTGYRNKDSGPDFFNARILIGNTLWAGNVEVHVRSSEWMLHGHHKDVAYNNVVLHIVYEHDENIVNQAGKTIPTLELMNRIPLHALNRFAALQDYSRWIACEPMLEGIQKESLEVFKHRLLVERLEEKYRLIKRDVEINGNHWEQTFYEYMARNFGFKTNALPFHIMARGLPLQVLARHRENIFELEALLFGQAGMLQYHFEEDYPRALKKEYDYLRKKYQLAPINEGLWKYSQMRPANFPTLRMAQFAQLIHQSVSLFSKCMETADIKSFYSLLNVTPTEYWDTHYQFDQPAGIHKKSLGKTSIQNIVINTVVPFMFGYGIYREQQALKDKALALLEMVPAESNKITRGWVKLNVPVKHAFDSQALVQLKNMYCNPKKCLSCHIGHQILKS